MAGDLGLMDKDLSVRAGDAYREFRRLQHALRLNGAQYARVPAQQVAQHRAAVEALSRALGLG
jgi:glutamate-ammonia-ligase adenylyltransferase